MTLKIKAFLREHRPRRTRPFYKYKKYYIGEFIQPWQDDREPDFYLDEDDISAFIDNAFRSHPESQFKRCFHIGTHVINGVAVHAIKRFNFYSTGSDAALIELKEYLSPFGSFLYYQVDPKTDFATNFNRKILARRFYRGGGFGWPERGLTAEDIVRYEREELGNDDVEVVTKKPLNSFPSDRLVWVSTTKDYAETFGDVEKVDIYDYEIIAKDYEDGLLLYAPNDRFGSLKIKAFLRPHRQNKKDIKKDTKKEGALHNLKITILINPEREVHNLHLPLETFQDIDHVEDDIRCYVIGYAKQEYPALYMENVVIVSHDYDIMESDFPVLLDIWLRGSIQDITYFAGDLDAGFSMYDDLEYGPPTLDDTPLVFGNGDVV
jgi:hypothetical protein